LQAAGFPVRQVRLADGHHLDVISKLADKDNELAQALVALIRA